MTFLLHDKLLQRSMLDSNVYLCSMKKILLVLILISSSLIGTAQIVLQKSSIASTSSTFEIHNDSNTKIPISFNAGVDASWDFQALMKHETDIITFRNADWYDSRVSSAVPGATYIFEDDGDYSYLKLEDSALLFMGSASDTGTGPLEAEVFGLEFVRFPISYGDTVMGEDVLVFEQEDSLGLVPGPGAPRIDSIRVQGFMNSIFVGEGTGTVNFGSDSFEKSIQIWNRIITYPKAYAKIGNNWIEIDENYANQLNIPYQQDTSNRMMWWNTMYGGGIPLLQYDFDNGQDSVSDVEFTSEDVKVSANKNLENIIFEAYPNPTTNQIKIKGVEVLNSTILITNLAGIQISKVQLSPNQVLDLSGLKAGIYLIYLDTPNGMVECRIQKM